MHEAKNTARALVRIGYDGRVFKQFLGPMARERFENEVRVLEYLEKNKCGFVPKLISKDETTLEIITSNCGQRVERMGQEKQDQKMRILRSF